MLVESLVTDIISDERAIIAFEGKIIPPIRYFSGRGIPQSRFILEYDWENRLQRVLCIAYGDTATFINSYVSRGSKVLLAGHPTKYNKGKKSTENAIRVMGISTIEPA